MLANLLSILAICTVIGGSIYGLYVHVELFRQLARHEPQLHKIARRFSPIRFAHGFAGIDMALSGEIERATTHQAVLAATRRTKHFYRLLTAAFGIVITTTAIAMFGYFVWFLYGQIS